MNFGHFDDVNKEYVITTPDTPLAVDQLSMAPRIFLFDFQHLRRLQFL